LLESRLAIKTLERENMNCKQKLNQFETENRLLKRWVVELKQTEENLLLKCNMMESTDPELAVMLKDIRDKEN